MRTLLTIIGALYLFSCNSTTKTNNESDQQVSNTNIPTEENTSFNFTDFTIMKRQLGKIKIGTTIEEAESKFSGLEKKVDKATSFGFGGGSPAYVYYKNDSKIFGLIPKLDTDTLLIIIAFHKDLKTTNGLNPNSTVRELIEKYPDLTIYQDLMSGGEYSQDRINGWDFVFLTNEKNQVGEYPELEVPSKPKRLTTKTDWITIR